MNVPEYWIVECEEYVTVGRWCGDRWLGMGKPTLYNKVVKPLLKLTKKTCVILLNTERYGKFEEVQDEIPMRS